MPYYNIDRLKKVIREGDIILSHGNSFISWAIRVFTQSYWNHATMYIGNELIIEANEKCVEILPLKKYENKDIYVYTNKSLTNKERKTIVNGVLKYNGTVYDYKQLFQFIWYFLTLQRNNGKRKMMGNRNRFVCSELVAKPYYDIGKPIIKGLRYWEITPADIDLSPYFERIKGGIIYKNHI
jgi:uncharacterized protein YycO